MKKKNNNITTIYHERHNILKLLAGSPAKAEFLSKLLFWWQISKYKIKNSDYTWFTRTTAQMAKESGLSESSVFRYLKDFTNKDLIEKRKVKRFSKAHDGEIACLHMRVTDKLLTILKSSTPSVDHTDKKETEDAKREFLSHSDETGSVNLTVPSYNKEKEYNLNNNTVSQKNNVSCVDKAPVNQNPTYTSVLKFEVEKKIGEMVSDAVKQQVKGMMINLEKQHHILLNNKERLFSEIIYAIINPQQFTGITCTKHKINIISRLLRQKRWATPKGFFNHFEIGGDFRQRDINAHRNLLQQKLDNALRGVDCPKQIADIKARFHVLLADETRHTTSKVSNETRRFYNASMIKINELNREIAHEERHLHQSLNALKQGKSHVSEALIASIKTEIDKLKAERQACLAACDGNKNERMCA